FPDFNYLFNATAGGVASTDTKIAVELQAMWKKELGLNVELRPMEFKVYLSTQRLLDYDTCRSSWVGDYNDAYTFLGIFASSSGNNRTGWRNARYDDLLQQANQQTDMASRERLLQSAETILVREDLPLIPIFFYAGVFCYDPRRIEGIYTNI